MNGTQRCLQLRIKSIIRETKDTISIIFDPPVNTIQYRAGQFLTLIISIDGKELRRVYSFSSAPGCDVDLMITVKRVEGGIMSNYLHDNLKIGDRIKVLEPMGQFTPMLDHSNRRHFIMIAGGSGITPMFSILKTIVSHEPETMCSLIYCNRDDESIIFKNVLDEISLKWECVQVIHVLEHPPAHWSGYSGLLTPGLLRNILNRIPLCSVEETFYLMCGPEGMMRNVISFLSTLNIPGENILKESFASKQGNEKWEGTTSANSDRNLSHDVVLRYNDEKFIVAVKPNDTILESALNQGIDVPYSCQSGLCTACRGRCISGKVSFREENSLSKSELEDGYVLLCVGYPESANVVIELG